MIPKPFYLQRPKLSFLFFFFFFNSLSSSLLLFLKFTYSGTEEYFKGFSDDGIVNLGSPPSERYTVTNLMPDTFYKFFFDGISSCGQKLSQTIKVKTIGSGKLGPISYLYKFFWQRQRNIAATLSKINW